MIGQSALNIMPVLASNRVGREDDVNSTMTFYGSSFMTDETGVLIESMDREEEGIRVHTYDLDKIMRKRREWGIFRDRRPEMYKEILTSDGKEHRE